MKSIIGKCILGLSLSMLVFSGNVFAKSSSHSTTVRGYTKSNGTYVAPHHRSRVDGNSNNNWSHRGNVNPYTGKVGTRKY